MCGEKKDMHRVSIARHGMKAIADLVCGEETEDDACILQRQLRYLSCLYHQPMPMGHR
jgi:hypothetical protein